MFNWCLPGIRSLRTTGGFTQSAIGEAVGKTWARQMAPVYNFLKHACEIKPGAETDKNIAYRSYVAWCEGEGHRPLQKPRFGQQLISVAHEIRSGRSSIVNRQGARPYVYLNLRLLGADEAVDD